MKHSIVRSPQYIPYGMKFDLIVMSHSLEHMLWPGQALYQLKGMASDSARLYVEVPNLVGDIALERAHMHAFTEETLMVMLDHSGWRPAEHFTHGYPKNRHQEAYISIIAEPKPNFDFTLPYPSPGGILTRRRLGLLKRMLLMAVYGGREQC
jgi:hypothetical protein